MSENQIKSNHLSSCALKVTKYLFSRSIVSFVGGKRDVGEVAKNQRSKYQASTVHNLKKNLIEPKVDDHLSRQSALQFIRSNSLHFFINGKMLDSIQFVAALFTKLKADADKTLHPATVTECVLAVPTYFSSSERKSVLLAAGVAGLSCRHLIKESTALAIDYGCNKTFPIERTVIFIDFGHTAVQICACVFSETKIETIAEAYAPIGGQDIDEMLMKHFLETSRLKVENDKFQTEFQDGIERLKIEMSADSKMHNLNVQHLISKDTELTMNRLKMEAVCSGIFDNISGFLKQFLIDSGLNIENVHSVEIFGGSSRIPAFKKVVEKVFEKSPRESLSQDDAISRGCFLRDFMSKHKKHLEIIEITSVEDFEVASGFGLLTIGDVKFSF